MMLSFEEALSSSNTSCEVSMANFFSLFPWFRQLWAASAKAASTL